MLQEVPADVAFWLKLPSSGSRLETSIELAKRGLLDNIVPHLGCRSYLISATLTSKYHRPKPLKLFIVTI